MGLVLFGFAGAVFAGAECRGGGVFGQGAAALGFLLQTGWRVCNIILSDWQRGFQLAGRGVGDRGAEHGSASTGDVFWGEQVVGLDARVTVGDGFEARAFVAPVALGSAELAVAFHVRALVMKWVRLQGVDIAVGTDERPIWVNLSQVRTLEWVTWEDVDHTRIWFSGSEKERVRETPEEILRRAKDAT